MECWKETSETGTGIRSNLLIKTEYKHDVPDFSLSFGSRNLTCNLLPLLVTVKNITYGFDIQKTMLHVIFL